MKTNFITSEGISGIQINLNLMDMYSIVQLVEKWEGYINMRKAYNEFVALRDKSNYWDMPREEREAWKAEHPEPNCCSPIFFEEIAPVLVFLKKLALPSTEQATVFEEETGVE